MKTIMSALLVLSVLTPIAGQGSAAELQGDPKQFYEQLDREHH